MIDGIDELLMEVKLKEPETNAIIQAYYHAEKQETISNVFEPLGKKYPSLNELLKQMSVSKNPIQQLEEHKNSIDQMKPLLDMASREILEIEMKYGDNESRNDKEFNDTKSMFSNLGSMFDVIDKYISISKQVYFSTANAIKDVSSTKGIAIEDVISSKSYRDEVKRIVFPTKEQAQVYGDLCDSSAKYLLDIVRTMIISLKKLGEESEELQKQYKALPTTKAMDSVFSAVAEYQTAELDRIYSAKQLF